MHLFYALQIIIKIDTKNGTINKKRKESVLVSKIEMVKKLV